MCHEEVVELNGETTGDNQLTPSKTPNRNAERRHREACNFLIHWRNTNPQAEKAAGPPARQQNRARRGYPTLSSKILPTPNTDKHPFYHTAGSNQTLATGHVPPRCIAGLIPSLLLDVLPDRRRQELFVPVGVANLQAFVMCNLVPKRLLSMALLMEQRLPTGVWGGICSNPRTFPQ